MRATSFLRRLALAVSLLVAPLATAQLKMLDTLGFTYQGELRSVGEPVSDGCDFQASLWNDPDAGAMLGVQEELLLVPVVNGRFTLTLNDAGEFGPSTFEGAQRWLQLAVRCGGDVAFTTLLPRQPLSPAPFAFALPGVTPGTFNVPSGAGNRAGPFSVAIGRRAKALNVGSVVIADSTNADFTSSADNQASVRMANGLFIANDAGGTKPVPVGTRYRDNAIVAWARVTSTGGLDSNFNVESVTRISTGLYRLVLRTSLQSGFSLIPAVTPEVDPVVAEPPQAPIGAANVRFAAVNLVAAGNTFDVYMYNGNFALVDNDFQVLVVGR